ncbi:manganase accumulation protein MntS [Mangrovibacter yixingensis]|nr:manganase accumulation protein MntS [Mangrovibacter yixingensis]
MNEVKRCLNVFSHSPFKVRLMLLQLLCERLSSTPRNCNDKSA